MYCVSHVEKNRFFENRIFVGLQRCKLQTPSILLSAHWGHVRTDENPADLASRGTVQESFLHEQLWWRGPGWLTDKWEDWNVTPTTLSIHIEERKAVAVFTTRLDVDNLPNEQLMSRFSTWEKLVRVLAHALQWRPRREDINAALFPSTLTAAEIVIVIYLIWQWTHGPIMSKTYSYNEYIVLRIW